MNATSSKVLTLAIAAEIGGALQQLDELAKKSIIESDDAARKRALVSYLQAALLEHAYELIGAWFTVEQEYKPLLQAAATKFSRILSILDQRNAIAKAGQVTPAAPAAGEATPGGAVATPADTAGVAPEQPDNVTQGKF